MGIAELERNRARRLNGRSVLIVEDEYFLASDLERDFGRMGIRILGPVPSLTEAMVLVQDKAIDLAVLDIRLEGKKVYPVADALI